MFLKIAFLFFVCLVVWFVFFEIIAPLLCGHPLFPSFRRKKKPATTKGGKANVQ